MTKTKTESIYDIKRKLNAMSHHTQTGMTKRQRDIISTIQDGMDKLTTEGVAHAALVLTYHGGQQIVIKSISAEAVAIDPA